MFISPYGLYVALAVIVAFFGTTCIAADLSTSTCSEIYKTTNELDPKFLACKVYHNSIATSLEAIRVTKELEQLLILNGIVLEENETNVSESTDEVEEDREKRKHEYLRFGKRKHEYLRFGKRKHEYLRFGKK
ncbi:FMRFamide-related peptide-like family-containing protein [Strongyloides ratti]|uniref:FMRFamide-related peptide-like family-containing protein n=1 Tax=Strongyloides ratti TaxID=34506 RepID=A0A090LLE9_STRRB|nr:FMRFamide-related peptide-like family-containing protein [Strongyloides ratti]CEF68365.1 FMRFamide-related peptide-like family-containing protein [Strongyloides ratti]